MKKFIAEFKEFALKGSLLDMAVGIMMGTAIATLVASLTDSFITPIITWVFEFVKMIKHHDFYAPHLTPGIFFGECFKFLIMALVIFLILKAAMKIKSIGKKPAADEAPTERECPYCISMISVKATKCPHCASDVPEFKWEAPKTEE